MSVRPLPGQRLPELVWVSHQVICSPTPAPTTTLGNTPARAHCRHLQSPASTRRPNPQRAARARNQLDALQAATPHGTDPAFLEKGGSQLGSPRPTFQV
jgi:hypothetical protein